MQIGTGAVLLIAAWPVARYSGRWAGPASLLFLVNADFRLWVRSDKKTSWPSWQSLSRSAGLHRLLDLTLRFPSLVGNRRLLNCRVKFSGPEGIFCGVRKVWLGLKVFELCGNRAILLSGVILVYCARRLLPESVQLRSIYLSWNCLNTSSFCYCLHWIVYSLGLCCWLLIFHNEVCGRKRERGKSWTLRGSHGNFTAACVGIWFAVWMYLGCSVIPKFLN